jgi:flagellar hook assembly protein FlgD
MIVPQGISEEVLISELKAYPNPFNDQLVIEFNNGVQNNVMIEVYDIYGRLLKKLNRSVIPNTGNRITWDGTNHLGSGLSNGIYLIILKDKNGFRTDRIVVVKN